MPGNWSKVSGSAYFIILQQSLIAKRTARTMFCCLKTGFFLKTQIPNSYFKRLLYQKNYKMQEDRLIKNVAGVFAIGFPMTIFFNGYKKILKHWHLLLPVYTFT